MEFSMRAPSQPSTPSSPNPNKPRNQASQNRFRPPIAPSPGGYQQGGSTFGNAPQNQQYKGTPSSFAEPTAEQGYFPPQPPVQPSSQYDGQNEMAGLTAQMGGMGFSQDAGAPQAAPTRKKKDRHAYHNLEAPSGSSQAFNGMPQAGTPSQYLTQNSLQIGTSMNQAPLTGNAPFAPGLGVPQAEHTTRMGTPVFGAPIQPNQGRVDPDQIPSVPKSRDVPARYYLENLYPTMERHIPPPAAVPFVAYDQGNSSPKFVRLSLNTIPSSQDALSTTGLPLGMILQPLAPLQEGEQEIPVLDFGETGPPRCRRCRAYINPFMQFSSGGNKFVCNLCTFPNDVTSEYFAPTDPSGVRVDRQNRPELTTGTVEFMVPKEYWTKEPVGLRLLFVVDVTAEASNKGFLAGFCEGILNALYGNSSAATEECTLPEGAKVGIMTYDKEVHFYNLSSSLVQAQMMVMPDIEDPFVPLSEGLFVDPRESKNVIMPLLAQLPDMFAEIKNPEPALLSTLNSAMSALTATGGKIICSLSALPTWGPGRLFLRDDGKIPAGTDGEKKMLTTEHPGWRKTAAQMVEKGIGVDFFMAAPSGGYLDIATVGHVSATTGGETYYYPNFHFQRDTLRLSKEIHHTVSRDTGYMALMKVRCSNGLQTSAYHGNFTHHTFGADLEFGVIDADKAIAVMFSYDGKLDPKLDVHFQSALLYTTKSGQRRVRCSNLVASISEGASEAMKFVDQDAVVHIIAKEAASRMSERSMKEIRQAITEKSIDILAGYRKHFSSDHPPGQLVLPENLKEFGMHTLGLIKSRAFKGGREPTDRRVHDARLIKSMGSLELSLYLYPRIIAIHSLEEGDGFAAENGHLRMPPTVRASFSRIQEGGVYLVDNGQQCLLWFHTQVSPNLLEDLFGPEVHNIKDLDPFLNSVPVLETHLNAQVRNILQYFELHRGSKALTVQLARQGLDGAEYEFARMLYEDRNGEAQSYVDWLVHLHRHIQLELAGQRKKETEDTTVTSWTGLRTPYWT
ncbi:hypothetical protein K402DRAFT_394384 [Aulographum hederae CBS 113979]|uniref:Sec23/Sec24 family protein n=1 Tax=Aulographum hederae CBS 113979 TaxID=1176131 RepID=A0A6G1GYH0_9PEZI|nr:hypothetical protein K402DRAFT_394384 [Aulographum hederae CBS 113979]